MSVLVTSNQLLNNPTQILLSPSANNLSIAADPYTTATLLNTVSPYNPLLTNTIYQPGMLLPAMTYSLPSNLDMNQNPNVQYKIAKYYYYRTIDDWLYNDKMMMELLKYFRVSDKGVDVVANLSDADKNAHDSQATVERKVDFIEKNVFTADSIMRLLKKFINETGITWVQLSKNNYFIKEAVYKYLKNKIISYIQNKK